MSSQGFALIMNVPEIMCPISFELLALQRLVRSLFVVICSSDRPGTLARLQKSGFLLLVPDHLVQFTLQVSTTVQE